jgi:hypothetical protein
MRIVKTEIAVKDSAINVMDLMDEKRLIRLLKIYLMTITRSLQRT